MTKHSTAVFIFLTLLSVGCCSELQTVNGTLDILVGSTSGCRFVPYLMTQVNATNAKYGKYIKWEFLPWGRTQRYADGSLICQFGEPDCWSNRVQRCALTLLSGNQNAQVQYMLCEFSDPFPAFRQRSLACTQRVGLNILSVDFCVSSLFGNTLEAHFEERSRAGMIGINRIPFVVFNNRVDLTIYNQVVSQGLEKVVCNALLADPTTSVTSC